MNEQLLTTAFVRWLRLNHPRVLFCGSMGGIHLRPSQAARAKREGYNRGIPDLMIYEPRRGYNGLAMEMKTATGTLSPHQIGWLAELERRKWQVSVPRSLQEAQLTFELYMRE
jgi:hypothetical protein